MHAASRPTANGGVVLKTLWLTSPAVAVHVRHPFDAVTPDRLTGLPRECRSRGPPRVRTRSAGIARAPESVVEHPAILPRAGIRLASRPDLTASPWTLDKRTRPVSNRRSGEAGEVPDNPFNVHPGNPGREGPGHRPLSSGRPGPCGDPGGRCRVRHTQGEPPMQTIPFCAVGAMTSSSSSRATRRAGGVPRGGTTTWWSSSAAREGWSRRSPRPGRATACALVERHLTGGTCVNYGCTPSKALIACRCPQPGTDLRLPPARPTRGGLRRGHGARAARCGSIARNSTPSRWSPPPASTSISGTARFAAKDAVEVDGRKLRFRAAVIATGSRARVPEAEGLANVGFWDHIASLCAWTVSKSAACGRRRSAGTRSSRVIRGCRPDIRPAGWRTGRDAPSGSAGTPG